MRIKSIISLYVLLWLAVGEMLSISRQMLQGRLDLVVEIYKDL